MIAKHLANNKRQNLLQYFSLSFTKSKTGIKIDSEIKKQFDLLSNDKKEVQKYNIEFYDFTNVLDMTITIFGISFICLLMEIKS